MNWLQAILAPVALLTAGLFAWEAWLAWQRREAPGGLSFCAVLLAAAVWNLSAGLRALSANPQQQIFWSMAQYLSLTLIGPTFFLFILKYLRLMKPWAMAGWMLFLVPAVTFLAHWTNDWHHWLWLGVTVSVEHSAASLRGPWFWANILYVGSLLFAGGMALLWVAIDFNKLFRLQMLTLAVAVFIPLGGSLAYFYPDFALGRFDPTPFFFAISGLLLLLTLLRFQLLDLQPIAGHSLLNTQQDAILVIDPQQRVVETNPAAARLLGIAVGKALGAPVQEYTAGFPALAELVQSSLLSGQTAVIRHPSGKWFEVQATPIVDHQGANACQMVTLHDVTTARQVEVSLEHQTAGLAAVADISLSIATTLDRPQVARTIVELTRFHFHYYAAQIYLLDPERECLVLAATSGPNQPEQALGKEVAIPLQQEQSMVAGVARRRRGWIVNNVHAEPAFLPNHLLPDTQAEMAAPIIFGSNLVGVLDVQQNRLDCFIQQDLDTLMTLAAQSAVALQNAHYFDQIFERQRQLSLLNEIAHSASSADETDALLQTLADQMAELIKADVCYITLWDEESQCSNASTASGGRSAEFRTRQPFPGEPTLTSYVLRTSRRLVVSDIQQSPYISTRLAEGLECHSVLALPLLSGEKKLGAALIGFAHPHSFTAAEISICEQAAGQLALAMAKNYALEEAQRQARETEILRQAGAAVAATLDKDEAIRRILDQVRRVIPYDSASVALLTDEQTMEIVGGYGFSDLKAVVGIRFHLDEASPNTVVVNTRQPVIIPDAPAQYEAFRHPPHNHIHGWLGVPLIVKDRVIGIIAIDSTATRAFTHQHARLAVAIADQVAIALENTRLFEDTQRLAVTDSLTGLFNRRHFFDLAHREFERSLRYRRPLSVVMIDIDHFKRTNDTYGHRAGDQVLQAITTFCRQSFRQSDLLGRYGGEEFVVLMPEASLDQAYQAAERLRQLIARTPIETQAGPIQSTISLGVHTFSPDAGYEGTITIDSEIERLVDRADQALLVSKNSGRNRVTIWNP